MMAPSPLQTRQVFAQLVRNPRYYLGLLAGLLNALMAVHAIPPTGRVHDVCNGLIAFLALYGVHAIGLWQAERLPWTHEQKLQESVRRIEAGYPPLQGYEYLLMGGPPPDAMPATSSGPAPLPPPPSTDPKERG